MAATTSSPTARKREPVTVLVTVCLDRRASTPFHELYRATSDTTIGRVYEVRHDVARGTWTCQCVGASHGHVCRHQRRCKRLRAVQWYHALFLGLGPGALRDERARRLARVADGWADEDEFNALDALGLLLHDDTRAA